MADVLIYICGLISGGGLVLLIRKCANVAAESARKSAWKEFDSQMKERTAAFNRGYRRGREDYINMSEVERFADTLQGHRVKLRAREARQHEA